MKITSNMPPTTGGDDNARVLAVVQQVMEPLARLLVARGLKFGQAEELLKRAFVAAGRGELERTGSKPNVSQISVSTGIHRKDVKRLLAEPDDPLRHARSFASELFTRWRTDKRYQHAGKPRVLPMRADGETPSFETLARTISTDVHPRSLLKELQRLGLVLVDPAGETISLARANFVPDQAFTEMLGLLGDSLGDHASAAVGNVLGDDPRWLEQAVFAQGLSRESVALADAQARAIWADALTRLAGELGKLIDDDRQQARPASHRVRVGMYAYGAPMPADGARSGSADGQGEDE